MLVWCRYFKKSAKIWKENTGIEFIQVFFLEIKMLKLPNSCNRSTTFYSELDQGHHCAADLAAGPMTKYRQDQDSSLICACFSVSGYPLLLSCDLCHNLFANSHVPALIYTSQITSGPCCTLNVPGFLTRL